MPDTHTLLIADARGIPAVQLLVAKKKPLEAAKIITGSLLPISKICSQKSNILSRAIHKIPHKLLQNRSEAKVLAKLASVTASKLSDWMARFNGVATKYLQQYWNWFRAQSNSRNFEIFRCECFGHRQLMYYRQITVC